MGLVDSGKDKLTHSGTTARDERLRQGVVGPAEVRDAAEDFEAMAHRADAERMEIFSREQRESRAVDVLL